jgi:hypothetical protein
MSLRNEAHYFSIDADGCGAIGVKWGYLCPVVLIHEHAPEICTDNECRKQLVINDAASA